MGKSKRPRKPHRPEFEELAQLGAFLAQTAIGHHRAGSAATVTEESSAVSARLEFVVCADDEAPKPEVRFDEQRKEPVTSVFVSTSIVTGLIGKWGERFEQARGTPRETQEWFLIYNTQLLQAFEHYAALVKSSPAAEVMPDMDHPVSESLERDFVEVVDHYVRYFRSRVWDYSQPLAELDSDDPLRLVETSCRTFAQLGQPATAEEELTVLMSSIQPFTAAHLYLALLRPQSILRL